MTLEIQPRTGDLVLRPIVTIAADGSLRAAARVMRTNNVSALVVDAPATPVAIITERDLTQALAEGRDPETPVAAVASPKPLTVAAEATAIETATRMLRDSVRHLIVTRGDRAVGIVSIRDVLGALVQTLTPDTIHLMIRQAWCEGTIASTRGRADS